MMTTSTRGAGRQTTDQSRSFSLPAIDRPPPPQPPRSGSTIREKRSTSKSGGSRSRRQRAPEKSGGTGTSDNRWTASEIAAFFGFDPNRTPSMNSASSVFPSSRFGESYASKSVAGESRATSPKSFITDLMDHVPHDHPDFPELMMDAPLRGRASRASSAWTNTLHYHFEPDYEEKKQRALKGKFGRQLLDYFPDLTANKKCDVVDDSADEAYDTDLDTDLGSELLAAERSRLEEDLGSHPEYKRHCQKNQVVPNSYFLRHINDEDFHLNFRYLSFGDSYTLAKEIENQPSINTLNLEDNAIGPAGMMCFADMLKKNSYIHEVNLSENKLGVIGARVLKHVLQKNARLVYVNLAGNGFGERGAKYLADVIDRNETIKHLYLSHNAIGDNGATLIGKALGNNFTLKTLDLSWNHIRRKGAFGFSKGLKTNCTLETLNLAMNGLHVEGTRLVMNGLRGNDCLKELDLSANRIDKEGAKMVARTLPHILQLTTLKLAFNPLTSEGAEQVVKALINFPFSPIQFVDFEGVTLEDYFELLAEEMMNQRQDTGLKLLYNIPPSSRERSIDLPVDTLTQLTDLLEENNTEIRELFTDVPDDDQLIMSTEDLFNRVKKSGRVSDPQRLSRLKQSVHRDLRRRFLLKDLLMLSTNRRHSHLQALKGAQALDTPELREVQNTWRYPRPHSSSYHSPLDDHSDPRTPDVIIDKPEPLRLSPRDVME